MQVWKSHFSFLLSRTAPAAGKVSPLAASLIMHLKRALRSMAAAGTLLRHQKEKSLAWAPWHLLQKKSRRNLARI